ncbi:MAG: hypothetical protein ABIP49_07020 [Lysobacterales bacterium]
MQTLTQQIIELGMADRVLSDAQLRRLVVGSAQRRYHLVHRAMAAGELLRLRRGRYALARAFRAQAAHPFALAQAFDAGSYVSFETALAHHGWIPESVPEIASVTPGRKSITCEGSAFGTFSFHPLALWPGNFLVLVERVEFAGLAALVARPARALLDLVCLRKEEWQGPDWLTEGLRIDREQLRTVTGADIRWLRGVYRQQRVQRFLTGLAREFGHD